MLTVAMPARNDPSMTARCLKSLHYSVRAFGERVRLLLIDDASPADQRLPELFTTFASQVPYSVKAVRFTERQHYTGVFNFALYETQQAAWGSLFFVSNDMICSPSFLQTLLAVSALDERYAVVRGTSGFVSGHPEHRIEPPNLLGEQEDVFRFSAYQAQTEGLRHTEDRLLSGDAVLVTRRCLEEVGLFDPRYFGYFSDVDYGLRVQQAGLKLICAKGAWLFHEGAGHLKAQARSEGSSLEARFEDRYREVQDDWAEFRQKWDPSLPAQFRADRFDPAELLGQDRERLDHGSYVPPSSLQVVLDRLR